MRVIVPFTPVDPKTRLAPVLCEQERRAFARVMVDDVLGAVRAAGYAPELLSPAAFDAAETPVLVDDRSLSRAVAAAIEPPTAVVTGDLPLLTPPTVSDALGRPGDVVIGPGRGGGTNLLVVRDERFRPDFHEGSLADHRRIATAAGLSTTEVDSFRISTDVDEPDDLVEVLLHGEGAAPAWLRDQGFGLEATGGRVTIIRE